MEVKPPFTFYKKHHNAAKLLRKFKNNLDYYYTFSTQYFSGFEGPLLNKNKKKHSVRSFS